MRFEKIWVEQCRATKGIKRRFGARSALDYLVVSKNPIETSKVPVRVWVGVARDTHGRQDDEQFRISD